MCACAVTANEVQKGVQRAPKLEKASVLRYTHEFTKISAYNKGKAENHRGNSLVRSFESALCWYQRDCIVKLLSFVHKAKLDNKIMDLFFSNTLL